MRDREGSTTVQQREPSRERQRRARRAMQRLVLALSLAVAPAGLAAGCGGASVVEAPVGTVATVTPVRGSATVAETSVGLVARASVGDAVAVAPRSEANAGGLARLVLDAGPRWLLDQGAHVTMRDATTVRLDAGRALVEAAAGEAHAVETSVGTLRFSDASVSLEVSERGLDAYVVRGEVSYVGGAPDAAGAGAATVRGVVHAGERLVLAASGAPSVRPEPLFADWTGGLLTAGPSGEALSPGVGVLEGRVPDEVGQARWPLSIRRLDVRVRVVGAMAITEVEEEFFNPASDTVEGLYRIRVPEGAVLQRFAVDRDGQLVDGFVREQAQARAAYEAQVYQGSTDDPALLEWDAPGSYRARIYPIQPGEVRRIAIRYAEWLRPERDGGARLYRYPMGEGGRAPHVQELSFVADLAEAETSLVRAGMGATVEGARVELRRSDFRPRADLFLELEPASTGGPQHAYRAAHAPPRRAPGSRVIVGEADERDYWYLPLRLDDTAFRAEGAEAGAPSGLDLVIVADVSAGTDRAKLELGRSMVESIVSRLGPSDRVSIVSADLAIRPVDASETSMALGPVTPERVERLLDGLARVPAGGATDLGASLAQAAALLDPARQGAIVYVGDGAPTVGELGAEGLVEHLTSLPRPTRLYAVGVGRDANLDLLSALARGGGLALRVEEREAAADATLAILAHASRPVLQRVTVDLGTGIENAFPRVPVDLAAGELLEIAGRVRETPPTEVVVRGLRNGEPFELRVPVDTRASEDEADLRLRWANERLRQLLLGGARREEIAELGTRYGLITPYTSFYVPSRRELASGMYGALDHEPLLESDGPSLGETAAMTALGLVLGPLSIAGCSMDAPSLPPMPSMPSFAPASEQEEAPMEVAASPVAPPPPATAAATAPNEPEALAESSRFANDEAAPAAAAAPMAPPASGEPADDLGGNFGYGGLGLEGDGRGGGGTGEGTIGLGNLGTIGHGAGGGSGSGYGSGATASRSAPQRARRAAAPTRVAPNADAHVERQEARERTVITTTTTTTVTIDTAPAHERRVCSDASKASLPDRVALWRERLSQTDYVGSWIDRYREAIRLCEIESTRDRRAFLDELLDRAGSLSRMVEVYGYLPDASARGFFRGAILRRVRTADDLRLVRSAFGLGGQSDWSLVEQVLARATTPAGRLHALRQLVLQTPGSLELQLRLLEELETQGRVPEARRLAERLRTDPLADPGVRTAIGELYLRLGLEDDARRTFSEIVEFQPMDELARRRLGDLYRAHGWFEDAYRQYETLASIRPDDPVPLLLLAQAAAGAGRVDEALRLEQRVMETSQGGASDGVARAATLWSSVRFAELRKQASAENDTRELEALGARMRRSGVLRAAGAMRVSLVWSHPDANLGLWAAHPGLSLSRPMDLYSELGIEAFDLTEQENAPYRFEVRRNVRDRLGTLAAQLVVVWNEGQRDEQIEVIPLTFDAEHRAYAWTVNGRTLQTSTPSAEALRDEDDAPSVRTPANGGAR